MRPELGIELFFAIACIGIAKFQAWWFDVKQRRINHFLWGAAYCLLILPAWLITRDWWLVWACVVMRVPVFNAALNRFRKPPRSIFYTNMADPKGSALDKLWGKHYRIVFFLSLMGLIILQFLIFSL